MASTALRPGGLSGIRIWNRELATYPERDARRMHLLLVVLITVTLYYELYVGSGVATIMLAQLKIPFPIFVYILAAGNLLGAFASLLAGLADRFGRANLVVYGLLVVGLITLFWVPNVTTVLEWGLSFGVVSFVEGIILVATPALIRDFAPQVGRATAMGFWTIGPVLGSLAVSAVNTLTLPTYQTWQSQFVICGVVGLVVFVLAFLFLRELAPALRDQLMVSERDRVLVELKAKGLDIEALVVKSVTPLIEAPFYIAAYQQALANHVTPPAPLLEALGAIKAAAAAAPGEWQEWYWICIGGVIVFIATIFVMRGRWSPAAARADEAAHDAAVARELHALQGS
jgi:MFS family permease